MVVVNGHTYSLHLTQTNAQLIRFLNIHLIQTCMYMHVPCDKSYPVVHNDDIDIELLRTYTYKYCMILYDIWMDIGHAMSLRRKVVIHQPHSWLRQISLFVKDACRIMFKTHVSPMEIQYASKQNCQQTYPRVQPVTCCPAGNYHLLKAIPLTSRSVGYVIVPWRIGAPRLPNTWGLTVWRYDWTPKNIPKTPNLRRYLED